MKQIFFAILAAFCYFWYIGEYSFIFAPIGFFVFTLNALHYAKVWQFSLLTFPLLTIAGFLAGRNMILGPTMWIVAGAASFGFTAIFILHKLFFFKANFWLSAILFGILVTSLEYLFGLINPFGAWTSSGYALFPILKYLNWLPIFGGFGVYFYSFLYAIISYFIFQLVINFDQIKERVFYSKCLVGIILIGLIFPSFIPSNLTTKSKNVKVGLVNSQTSASDNMYNKLDRISKIALNSDIVLTGEAFFRFNNYAQQTEAFDKLASISKTTNSYIFVGLISVGENLKFDRSNKLVGWNPKGEIVMNYTKANLLPIEVYIYNKGKSEIPFVDTEFGRIGGVICFDSDHPEYISQSRLLGLDYLLVPVNEWSGIAHRHTQQIAFRAKENNFTVINSAVNGSNRITNSKGEEIFSSVSEIDGKSDIVVEVRK